MDKLAAVVGCTAEANPASLALSFVENDSELYYVEVSYDFVGTVDGEQFDETYSGRLPVAQIDGVRYVLDGVVK